MPVPCPACGHDVDVSERPVSLLAGACPSCSHEVVLWSSGAGTAPTAPVPVPPAEDVGAALLTLGHPDEDDDCDGKLTLAVAEGGRLVGTCGDCGSEFVFVVAGAPGDEDEEDDDEDDDGEDENRPAPPRPPGRMIGEDRGGFRDRPRFRSERPSFGDRGAPPSRPCRRCGGPLTFETGENGGVVGRCASCGNTFSLPPRRTGGPGGRFGGGGGRGRFGGGGGGRGRFDRGGGGGFRPNNRGRFRDSGEGDGPGPRRFRRRPSRDDDEE